MLGDATAAGAKGVGVSTSGSAVAGLVGAGVAIAGVGTGVGGGLTKGVSVAVARGEASCSPQAAKNAAISTTAPRGSIRRAIAVTLAHGVPELPRPFGHGSGGALTTTGAWRSRVAWVRTPVSLEHMLLFVSLESASSLSSETNR